MSFSPKNKKECIECLEVCYGRKLTTDEKSRNYQALYAWYKRRQSEVSAKSKDFYVKKLVADLDACNRVCKLLNINRVLKYAEELEGELNTLTQA